MDGVCVKCKEHCEVGDSCCGQGVYFDGHIYHDEDVENMRMEQKAAKYANEASAQYGDVAAAWGLLYDAYRQGWIDRASE